MSALNEGLGILVIAIICVIVAATTGVLFNKLNDAIQDAPGVSQLSKDNAELASESWGSSMDWLLAVVMIGLPLVSMGLAYFNDIPPFFFYITIGFLLVMVILGWALQSGLQEIMTDGGVIGAYITGEMPITAFILNNFGMYSLLVLLLIGIGTYVKQRGGVGYGGLY